MKILKTILSASILGLVFACGGNTSKESQNEERQPTSQEIISQRAQENADNAESSQEVSTNADADVVEITIEATDQMKFNKQEIRVKAGQTVKLTLKHVGEMSVEQMGHNWVLLTKDTDFMDFAQKAATAKANDYIPEAASSQVITHTELLGGGEQDTIEFEAPEKGKYTFICSFPGHAALMNGEFIVE